jgi:hypothetical protein
MLKNYFQKGLFSLIALMLVSAGGGSFSGYW